MEDLSPELSSLKEEIEESANVTEEVRASIPNTDSDSSTSAAEIVGVAAGAMSKAKEAMEKLDEREDGITDEEEINLNEMHQSFTAPVTPPEPVGESIDFGADAPPEPETVISTYSAEDMMVAKQSYELSNRVAQMVPAEYEEWMFPPMGHPGYHLGQLCLSRVIANLSSAGYNSVTLDEDPVVYPRKVQIAASTWSQTHYSGEDLDTTRRELTMAPASEIQTLIPSTSTMIDDLVSSRYPPMDVDVETVIIEDKKSLSPLMGLGVVAATGLTSMILPIYLVRRWTKL